jgi:hypothetical protein
MLRRPLRGSGLFNDGNRVDIVYSGKPIAKSTTTNGSA